MVLRQLNREPSDERRNGKQTSSRPLERGVKPRIQGNGDFDSPSIDEPCPLRGGERARLAAGALIETLR